MEIPISLAGFEGKNLVLETAGFFRGPRILENGIPVERRKGRYSLRNTRGEEVVLRLKSNHFDPIPRMIVGDQTIILARPLKWYEYMWIGLPIVLVLEGGGLGALVGLMATYGSARVFRSDRGTVSKYVLTAVISIAAVIAFVILAIVAQLFIGQLQR